MSELSILIMRQSNIMDRIDQCLRLIDELLDKSDHDRIFSEAENLERLLNIFFYFYQKVDYHLTKLDKTNIGLSWPQDINAWINKTYKINQELIKSLEKNKRSITTEISRLHKGKNTLIGYNASSVK